MLRNVFLKTLRDQRRSLLWWGIGLLALTSLTVATYPAVTDVPEGFDEFLEQLPEALARIFIGGFTDFTSPEGFLNTQLFVLVVPIMFVIFAVLGGSGAIAGEEGAGTLSLLLTSPLPRWRIVVQKFGAVAVATFTLALLLWVSLAIGAVAVDLDVSTLRLAAVSFSTALLGVAFGALALALGCITGARGTSAGAASGVAMAAYFLNALAPISDVTTPLQKLSPFYYFIGADPLTNGLNILHVSVLLGLTAVALGVALLAFERRDVRG
ncbi:MAG: ABC transporter permease subunit [Chloroflexi bacterium]|nr:ABC transporter permease subunit [Chloroflexota bacterium]